MVYKKVFVMNEKKKHYNLMAIFTGIKIIPT